MSVNNSAQALPKIVASNTDKNSVEAYEMVGYTPTTIAGMLVQKQIIEQNKALHEKVMKEVASEAVDNYFNRIGVTL